MQEFCIAELLSVDPTSTKANSLELTQPSASSLKKDSSGHQLKQVSKGRRRHRTLARGKRVKIIQFHARKRLYCPKCRFNTVWRTDFQYHFLNHCRKKPFKCDKCRFEINVKFLLDVHKLKHHKTFKKSKFSAEKKRPKGNRSRVKRSLAQSRKKKTQRGKVPSYKCCKLGFTHQASTKTGLKQPESTHLPTKFYQCEMAGCTFQTSKQIDFRYHHIAHTTTQPFNSYQSNYSCATNRGRDTPLSSLQTNRDKGPESGCNYQTSNTKFPILHSMPLSGPYLCQYPDCLYQTKYRAHFIRHQDTHTVYKCSKEGCSYKTGVKENLTFHLFSAHNQKVYKCNIEGCNYMTVKKQCLLYHRASHPIIFKCGKENCNYKTQGKKDFERHGLSHENAYKCLEIDCRYETNDMTRFRLHREWHSCLKPFKCQFPNCKYETKFKRNLTRHQKIHK